MSNSVKVGHKIANFKLAVKISEKSSESGLKVITLYQLLKLFYCKQIHNTEKMMIGILFVSFLLSVKAQADTSITCVNDLIKWCENKDYGNIGQDSSVSSISDNGSYQVVSCMSNSRGTNCSKNDSPWIECSTDHKVTYKGTTLRKNSGRGADNEICDASRFVKTNGSRMSTNVSKTNDKMFEGCFPFCDNNPFA